MNAWRAFLNFLHTASLPVQLLGVVTIGVVAYLLISSGVIQFIKGKPAEPTPTTKTTPATNTQTATNVQNLTVIASGVASPLDYPTKDGRPEKSGGTDSDPVNIDALNQKEAPFWHNRHSEEDNPPWQYIMKGDNSVDYVKYRYFAKSDGCLDIQRKEKNVAFPVDKWVTISLPLTRLHVDAVVGEVKAPSISPDQVRKAALSISGNELAKHKCDDALITHGPRGHSEF
jgi:hypothetical protein